MTSAGKFMAIPPIVPPDIAVPPLQDPPSATPPAETPGPGGPDVEPWAPDRDFPGQSPAEVPSPAESA